MKVRTYEVIACPIHGTAKLQHGICRVVTDRSKTGRITYCHAQETVTAVDLRDVEPLLEAARFMCRAAAGTVNARGSREAEEALRIFDKASDGLAEALEPFASTGGER